MPFDPNNLQTPTLILCQQLADAMLVNWGDDKGTDDGVDWDFAKRFGDASDPSIELVGRQVVIFPTNYDNGPVTRGEDEFVHNLSVLVVERYKDAGDPPKVWTMERVEFVYLQIVQGFDFGRESPDWNPRLVTLSSSTQVVDTDKLMSGGKLFYSMTELVFSEIQDA